MTKTFSVYRSSAGSGKTRTLAKAWLRLALQFRNDYFKHILAVTFTNKASQEMKDRILEYLDAFARGEKSSLAEELQTELSMDDQTFRQHSQETQSILLHQYDNFAISTYRVDRNVDWGILMLGLPIPSLLITSERKYWTKTGYTFQKDFGHRGAFAPHHFPGGRPNCGVDKPGADPRCAGSDTGSGRVGLNR